MSEFSVERVRRLGMGLQALDSRQVLFVVRPGMAGVRLTNQECMEILGEIAARWNAVLDALSVLEDRSMRSADRAGQARAILRKATKGEGE